MKKLILVRHGQSLWNELNLFTGWTDIDLTAKGMQEAFDAGLKLKQQGYEPQICYTSCLKRAIKTMNQILDAMDLDWIPIQKLWRLNEKHYGILQGKNKKEMVEQYGQQQVQQWRRGYDCPPPQLEGPAADMQKNDQRYHKLETPLTESLKDCIDRLMPCYYFLQKSFRWYDQILVVAHGNSLRGIVKSLKGISDEDIADLNLPTAIPYIFTFDNDLNLQQDFFLASDEDLKRAQQEVANQSQK